MVSTPRHGLTAAIEAPNGQGWRKGILLGDYIKFHAPETFVRIQLDRSELRYTWSDDGNARASDDGGPSCRRRAGGRGGF